MGQALQNRPIRLKITQTLDGLVAQVARLQIRKDKNRGLPFERTDWAFDLGHLGHKGRVKLQFSVYNNLAAKAKEGSNLIPRPLCGLGNLNGPFGFGRSFGGVREHSNPSRYAELMSGDGSSNGNIGQLSNSRIFHKAAIGKKIGFLPSTHKKHARNGRKSFCRTNNLKGRTNHISRGVNGPPYQTVCISAFDHHGSKINIIFNSSLGRLKRNAFGLADFIKPLPIQMAVFGGFGVDNPNRIHRCTDLLQFSGYLVNLPKNHYLSNFAFR